MTVLQIAHPVYMAMVHVMKLVIICNVIMMKGIAYVPPDARLICYLITFVMLYVQRPLHVTLITSTVTQNALPAASEVK